MGFHRSRQSRTESDFERETIPIHAARFKVLCVRRIRPRGAGPHDRYDGDERVTLGVKVI